MYGRKRNKQGLAWCVCILVLMCQLPLFAQSESRVAIEESLQKAQMISASSVSLPYFSGNSYQMPSARYLGDPWLLSGLLPGSLHWLGTEYEAPFIRYDLVLDQLTVLIPSSERDALISLSPLLVDQFSIGDRKFLMPQWLPAGDVPAALSEGYHEQVFVGDSISFLVKHQKKLFSENRSYGIEYSYDDQSIRYVYLRGEYFRFKGNASLLKTMKKHKQEIRKMMRDRSIIVRKAALGDLIPLFELYESLSAGE